MRKTILILLSLCASAPALASAALPDPAAVAQALDQHPMVAAARARVGAAEADARAHAKGPHEMTLSTSVTRRTVDFEGQFTEYDAQLMRPIRLPGKASLDRAIGRHGMDAATNRAEDAKHQAALLLADSWWDWLAASAEAQVDQVIVENHDRLVAALQRRESLGDASRLEVDQTAAALASARVGQEQSQGRAKRARVRIETQFPALPLPATAPEVQAPAAPEQGWDEFRAMILANSHEIGAARAEAARSSSLAARARREKVGDPSIGVRVFSERNGVERGGGLVLSIPFGGGHRSALAEKAMAEASALDAEARLVEANVAEVAATDIAEAQYRLSAWERARDALGSQFAALAKLRRGFDLGEVDLADLLLGERQVGEAFRTEAQTRIEAHRAVTRVRIDSHDLWLKD